jgi:hypothetical protein
MALSPIAALSLPILQNEQWRESARQFADGVRGRIHQTLDAEGFQRWAREMDDNMTFMDWTYKYTGVDMSYIWDPELWVKFKEAVWQDRPELFWNKLAERVEYSEWGKRKGWAVLEQAGQCAWNTVSGEREVWVGGCIRTGWRFGTSRQSVRNTVSYNELVVWVEYSQCPTTSWWSGCDCCEGERSVCCGAQLMQSITSLLFFGRLPVGEGERRLHPCLVSRT